MYKISEICSDYQINFSGLVNKKDLQEWIEGSSAVLKREAAPSIGVLIDIRALALLPPGVCVPFWLKVRKVGIPFQPTQ
jgi:hypothetical protein